MNEKLELNSQIDLGMGSVILKRLGVDPLTMDLGLHRGSIGRRSIFDSSGFRKGSEVLFVLPKISILVKEEILKTFLTKFPVTESKCGESATLRLRIEHKREYARTFFWRRPLFITTTLLNGIWGDSGLKKQGMIFSGLVTMDSDAIEIKKEMSFFGRILFTIREWKL